MVYPILQTLGPVADKLIFRMGGQANRRLTIDIARLRMSDSAKSWVDHVPVEYQKWASTLRAKPKFAIPLPTIPALSP